MDLYDRYEDRRDEFEIIAIHDNSAQTFEEVDEKMAPLRKKYWNNRQLPFPVVLDTGKTYKTWGITGMPHDVLIDPDGNIVRTLNPTKELESVLSQEHPAPTLFNKNSTNLNQSSNGRTTKKSR